MLQIFALNNVIQLKDNRNTIIRGKRNHKIFLSNGCGKMSNYCQIQVKNETHSRLNKIRGNNLLEKGKSKSFSEIINDALDLLEKQELKSEVQ